MVKVANSFLWNFCYLIRFLIGADESADINDVDQSETISAAFTGALPDHGNQHNSQMDQSEELMDEEDRDRLLKDVAAAVDICHCNPCRCDPLLNDCSVSCNPVVDSLTEDSNQPRATAGKGCGCGCGKKSTTNEPMASKSASRMTGCGCNCEGSAPPASHGDVNSVQHLASMPSCHPPEALPCSQSTDPDPCCIVVCLKHLKRQYLMDRPKCCA